MSNNSRVKGKFRGQARGQRVYMATLLSNALVLLILGLIILFGLYAKNLSIKVREDLPLLVIMNEDTKELDIEAFQKQLLSKPFVNRVLYISKDSAAKSLKKDLEGEDFLQFLGYNPLNSSVEIYLKYQYVTVDSIQAIKTLLLHSPVVKQINYQDPQIDSISKNLKTLTIILLVFLSINLAVAVSLIYVTVRLSIFSKRFAIKTMQLFGATKQFIQGPFLKSSTINGFLAGILAPILLMILIYLVERAFPELRTLRSYRELGLIFLTLLLTGIILSFLSTYFAVRRYLRRKIDDLY